MGSTLKQCRFADSHFSLNFSIDLASVTGFYLTWSLLEWLQNDALKCLFKFSSSRSFKFSTILLYMFDLFWSVSKPCLGILTNHIEWDMGEVWVTSLVLRWIFKLLFSHWDLACFWQILATTHSLKRLFVNDSILNTAFEKVKYFFH